MADGRMFVDETPVTVEGLGWAIETATHADRDQRIFLRADKSVSYERIMGR